MKKIIDHKIHLKADLSRSPDESADFEKVIMCLVIRMSARKIKRSTISSETKVRNSEDIADIGLDLKKHPVYYELQKIFTPKYLNKITERDLETDTETIIIKLKPLIEKYGKIINELKKDLEPYILEEK